METVDKFEFITGKIVNFFKNQKASLAPLTNLLQEEEVKVNDDFSSEKENQNNKTPKGKNLSLYFSQQSTQAMTQEKHVSFTSPVKKNNVNAFDLSELKKSTNLIDEVQEEKKKEYGQRSQKTPQKLKRVKMSSFSEKRNQNSLSRYGFFTSSNQITSLTQQPKSTQLIDYGDLDLI